jgi:hypothetical protein
MTCVEVERKFAKLKREELALRRELKYEGWTFIRVWPDDEEEDRLQGWHQRVCISRMVPYEGYFGYGSEWYVRYPKKRRK